MIIDKKFIKEVHGVAKSKGWWDEGHKTPLECMALVHSEVSEACEEIRKGTNTLYYEPGPVRPSNEYKPEGTVVELADVVLRILDFCEYEGLDLLEAIKVKHEFNKTRPYKHGRLK